MLKYNIKISFIVLVLVILVTAGCGKSASDEPKNNSKMTVAVSIVPEATFVKAVGGDLVDVVTLIPPGKSPENYAPSPQELEKFSTASIYFSIGVPAEKDNILPKLATLNKKVKLVSLDGAAKKVYKERELSPSERDPHVWMSPKRVQVMIKTIASELSLQDPNNEAIYQKNAAEYIKKLQQVDEDIKKSLLNLTNKTIIVYHPAFGYFCDDYGLTMIALEEEGKEANPADLIKKIDFAKEQGIKVIFYQAEIDSRQSKAFAQELGGKTIQIAPLAPDYIDNLSKIAKTFYEVLK